MNFLVDAQLPRRIRILDGRLVSDSAGGALP